MRLRIAVAALLATLAVAAPAAAATFTPFAGFNPNGLVREADGTLWVTNEFSDQLNQVSATGARLKTVTVNSSQLVSMANGPDGKVYVTSADGLFGFDPSVADGATLTPTYITPAASATC